MTAPPEIRVESASSADALLLIAELDALIEERYPGLPANGLEPDFEENGGVFLIAFVKGVPAASGALRPEGDAAEVKRMYVRPAHRRLGLARAMLAFLEEEAVRRGFGRAILETGVRQPEAISLYTSAGWKRIPPYGIYMDEPLSVCFEKLLDRPADSSPPPVSRRRGRSRQRAGRACRSAEP